jgi:hypothetical protein
MRISLHTRYYWVFENRMHNYYSTLRFQKEYERENLPEVAKRLTQLHDALDRAHYQYARYIKMNGAQS